MSIKIGIGKIRITPLSGSPVIPVVSSASVEDATKNEIVIIFSATINNGIIPATTDFTVTGQLVSLVSIVGNEVRLTVPLDYASTDVITVDYVAGANPLTGITGGLVASFSQGVTNNIVPPAGELFLTFDDIANAALMIGGDVSLVADWNTFFNSSTGTPFTSVSVVGNVVELKGGSGLTMRGGLFSDNPYYLSILEIDDTLGCIIAGDYLYVEDPGVTEEYIGVFYYGIYDYAGDTITTQICTNLTTCNFPALTTAGQICFNGCSGLTTPDFSSLTTAGDGCFNGCSGLTTPDFSALTDAGIDCFNGCTNLTSDFPALTTSGSKCFNGCSGLTTPDFSSLTTAGDSCFSGCINYITISLPSLTPADNSLGNTAGDNGVFFGITGNAVITLTVPVYFQTNNSGGPDGDIAYLVANNTLVNITYV